MRVGYVYLEAHSAVFLIVAYSKQERDNLSAEDKKAIRKLIQRLEKQFERGEIR